MPCMTKENKRIGNELLSWIGMRYRRSVITVFVFEGILWTWIYQLGCRPYVLNIVGASTLKKREGKLYVSEQYVVTLFSHFSFHYGDITIGYYIFSTVVR
jgi:hypothetical protein